MVFLLESRTTCMNFFMYCCYCSQPEEDVSQFRFSKFAATYFQGGANPVYIRRPLKQSLLSLASEADSMVSWKQGYRQFASFLQKDCEIRSYIMRLLTYCVSLTQSTSRILTKQYEIKFLYLRGQQMTPCDAY